MKIKYIKNFSFFFSIIFLTILTVLIGFFFLISFKPIKINFINYFDRESKILRETELKEIGDIYLSFNKKSKNFEILIEDTVISNSYIETILMSLNLKLSRDFLNVSIKIFDGDFTLKPSLDKQQEVLPENLHTYLQKNLSFMKFFNVIELINCKFSINLNHKLSLKYFVDLKFGSDEIIGVISELNDQENYFSFNLQKASVQNLNIEMRNFDISFIKLFLNYELLKFSNLRITGASSSQTIDNQKVEKGEFDFSINGLISFNTNSGEKLIKLVDNKLEGSIEKEDLKTSLLFNDKNSNYSIGLESKINQNASPIFFLNIDRIDVKNLLKNWPKDLANSVYFWMNDNSKGFINNVELSIQTELEKKNLKFKTIKGKFECDDVEIKYMDSMPSVKNIYANATMENSRVLFDVYSGNSNNLQIKKGIVDLYDLDQDFEKANIDLNIFSKNEDVVNYLRQTNIEKNNYEKLNKIQGEVDLELNLQFPLLVDLEAEQIRYKSKANISNGSFKNVLREFSIDDLKLEIEVDEEFVKYEGKGFIKNSGLSFNGEQISKKTKIIDNIQGQILLERDLIDIIINKKLSNINGYISTNFSYSNQGDDFKIEGIGELDKFYAESEFLGENLDFKNGKIRFIVSPYNEKYSGFLDMKTRNIVIEVNSIFDDSDILSSEIPVFRTPKQDFNLIYLNDEYKEFEIKGRKLMIKEMELKKESFLSDVENLKLNLGVEEFYIGNTKFTQPKVDLTISNDYFESLLFELSSEKAYHKVEINDDNSNKKFVLESNYVPGLLKLFDIDLKVNTGSLKIEGIGEKIPNGVAYTGLIAGKDFVFLDAPFFADFISLFSLQGLAQKLKDGGIIFEDLNAKYEFKDNKLRIIDSLMKGSELGIQFDTVIGLDNDYFMTNGSIIPAYTINTLLTKFPIVGDIITAGSPEDGLIGAKFKVEKKGDEYDVSYNPISVFVPNVIKNFLGD